MRPNVETIRFFFLTLILFFDRTNVIAAGGSVLACATTPRNAQLNTAAAKAATKTTAQARFLLSIPQIRFILTHPCTVAPTS